jgi:hypothetical protein
MSEPGATWIEEKTGNRVSIPAPTGQGANKGRYSAKQMEIFCVVIYFFIKSQLEPPVPVGF